MSDATIKSVPEDFPHEDTIGSVAGAQPKFAARLIEGRYVVGQTEEERLERYLICDDLAIQLSDYCRRKGSENPGWTKEFILQRTDQGVTSHIRSGRWDISIPEKGWVMQSCKELLGW